jgi:hypothetical protein
VGHTVGHMCHGNNRHPPGAGEGIERRASISKASKPSAAAAATAFAVSRKSAAVVQTAPCKMLTLVETPARAASASSSGSAWAKGWSGGMGARVAKRLFNQHREGLFRQIQGNSSSRSHAEQKPANWLTRQYSIPLSRRRRTAMLTPKSWRSH